MKEWWQKIFSTELGEAMFEPRQKHAREEVNFVLSQLKLKPKSSILDLACGVGRHSILFSKRNFNVTGLDYSRIYLNVASKRAQKEKVPVKFVHGDMKNLKKNFEPKEFDCVVSLFNSFGYFQSKRNDFKMLKEINRVLKRNGLIVLNTLNGDGVVKAMKTPFSKGREVLKNLFVFDEAYYDSKKKKTFAKWTIIDVRNSRAKVQRAEFSQNVYTHRELNALLKKAGFKIETTWGLLHEKKFDPKTSWHQTVMARKIK